MWTVNLAVVAHELLLTEATDDYDAKFSAGLCFPLAKFDILGVLAAACKRHMAATSSG